MGLKFKISQLDIKIFYAINHLSRGGIVNFFFQTFHYLTALGIGWIVLWIILLLVKKGDRKRLFFGAGLVIITWIIEGGIIKNLAHRARPPTVLGNVIVGSKFLFSYSFPSGQVAVSFAVATTLALLYPRKWFVYLAFIFSALVGISRIYLGAHYPSDVLGGIIIGVLIPVILFRIFYRKFNFENLPAKSKLDNN